jgi:NADPH:quinone reductase-like Zn-dependent oxidoreductase
MATMRALVCRKLGDPTQPLSENSPIYVDEQHPKPKLTSPTSVLVKVVASSVNFATGLQIEGKYQEQAKLPYVPGEDFSGTVLAVGDRVTKVKPGDAVCGVALGGAFAEEMLIDASSVYKVPNGCDLLQAGCLPIAFGTSHLGLVYRANLKAGQVLLVLGAAGGVGSSAVQIGKLLGAVVIGVARGKEKGELLKSLGADLVVDPTTGDLIKTVKTFLASRKLRGVDVLYDPVGGKLFKDSMKLLNWGAQVLIIGFTSGEIPNLPANILLVKNLTVHGLYWGSYQKFQPQTMQESMQSLLELLRNGSLHVPISHKFSLYEANKAFAMLSQREARGKVMILPAGTQSKL